MVTALIIIIVLLLSRLLFIPTLLGAFKLKQLVHKMNQDKWNQYFSDLSMREYLQRIGIFLLIPVTLCSILSFFLFKRRHDRKKSVCLTTITFLCNAGQAIYKLHAHRRELIDKIRKIKEAAKQELCK